MKLTGILFYTVLMVLLFSACGNHSGVGDALEQAGSNRSELEKVLAHYSGDSLKLEAARFLIENMPGHFSYHGEAMDFCKQKLAVLHVSARADSMNTVWKQAASIYPDGKFIKRSDCAVVTSAYLIANIDQAFRTWKQAPWHNEISFDIFCRYILPYRISDEQFSDNVHWRDSLAQRYADYIHGVTDMKQAFTLLSKVFDDTRKRPLSKCPYMLDALITEEAGFSLCEQRCVVRGSVMRALGLPVVCDYVNGWANYSMHGHLWISLVGSAGEAYTLYEGDSIPRIDNPIDASFF